VKRSGPPERRTRLSSDPEQQRAWEQRSRKRLPRKSAKRRAADDATAELRALVAASPCLLRSPTTIVLRLPSGDRPLDVGACAGPGTPHHLQKAGAGGPTDLSNLVPLCAYHNGWVEDYPPLAQLIGLVVKPGIDEGEALLRRIAAGIG
jgi:hypothetical protein